MIDDHHRRPRRCARPFVDGMSRAATSVSVVTTDGPAGRGGRHGLGDDLDLGRWAEAHDAHLPQRHLLGPAAGAGERVLLRSTCCGRARPTFRTSSPRAAPRRAATSSTRSLTETLVTGAPCLSEALVSFDCRLISAERVGTHHICIGAVEAVRTSPEGSPLLYGMRRYLRPEDH